MIMPNLDDSELAMGSPLSASLDPPGSIPQLLHGPVGACRFG